MNKQGARAGIYSYKGDINGRKYWLKSDGTQAIWYVPEFKDWVIGGNTTIGTRVRGITSHSSTCPHDTQNIWKYYDQNYDGGKWISSNDIKLNCNAGNHFWP